MGANLYQVPGLVAVKDKEQHKQVNINIYFMGTQFFWSNNALIVSYYNILCKLHIIEIYNCKRSIATLVTLFVNIYDTSVWHV